MLPYYLLLLLPGLAYFGFTHSPSYKQADRRTLTVFFVLYFLLLALRGSTVGNDYGTYYYWFESAESAEWSYVFRTDIEPGYFLLNKIVSVFTDSFQWFLVIASAIMLLPILYVYRKHVEDAPLTILLFINTDIFVMFFSGIRQSIAIGIGCLAFEFAREKKPIKFLLAVGIAWLFHASAFVLLLLYPACRFRLSRKSLYYIIPAYLILLVFNREIFTFLLGISGIYSGYGITQTGAFMSIVLFSLFVVYSIVIPDENRLDETGKMLRNILLITLAIMTFAPIHMMVMRMAYYFVVFMPLCIPKIVKYHDESQRKITEISKIVMLVFFTVYFFYFGYRGMATGEGLHSFPYHFFWEAT